MECGEKISRLRKLKGMTQSDLGEALNVTYQAVSKWERGESLPDFDTICKLAKLFGVPLNYFGTDDAELDEQAIATATAPAVAPAPVNTEIERPAEMIGVCTVCGRALHEGENEEGSSKLICKACAESVRKWQEEQARQRQLMLEAEQKRVAAAKEAEQKKVAAAKEAARRKARAEKEALDEQFRRRTIWASVVAVPLAIIFIISGIVMAVQGDPLLSDTLGIVSLIISVFLVPCWAFQLFWDGAVRTVTCWGFFAVKLPGIIFTADLDGLIFLVVMKVLLTVLSWIISLLAIVFTSILAMFVGLFSFIPICIKIHKRNEDIL